MTNSSATRTPPVPGARKGGPVSPSRTATSASIRRSGCAAGKASSLILAAALTALEAACGLPQGDGTFGGQGPDGKSPGVFPTELDAGSPAIASMDGGTEPPADGPPAGEPGVACGAAGRCPQGTSCLICDGRPSCVGGPGESECDVLLVLACDEPSDCSLGEVCCVTSSSDQSTRVACSGSGVCAGPTLCDPAAPTCVGPCLAASGALSGYWACP